MRVLLVNTSERIGGAAIAANRLMEALKNNGIKAKMLVRDKQTNQITVVALDPSIRHQVQFVRERAVIWMANKFKKNNLFQVDIANTGTDITELPEFKQADVIHLHWINQGFLSLKDIEKIIASGKPVVWTLHDMWPFTGICHYASECDKYKTECRNCPLIYGGGSKNDLSHRTYLKKKKIYSGSHLHFVACSHWLEDLAKQSSLIAGHSIQSIPNAINNNLFKPRDKKEARQKCNLPQDKKLLLFGSLKVTDERKGAKYLIEACQIIKQNNPELADNLGVVMMGNKASEMQSLLPFPVYNMDYVSDEHTLVNVYNAVDLYVTPSLQDNLPNTIVEAMSCGTPCVGFNVGGIPQMIDHLHNGYVAEYKNASDFANGICWCLGDDEHNGLSEMAYRKAAASYSESNVAMQYINLYNKITGKHA